MQTLTPEELKKAKDLRASGLSTNEIFTRLASDRTGTPLASSYTPVEGIGGPSATQKDIAQTFTDIGGSFKRFSGNIGKAFTQENLTLPQRATGAAVAVPTLGLDVAGDVLMGGLRTAAPEKLEQKTSEVVSAGVTKALETPFAQDIMGWYDNLSPEEQYTTSQIILPLAETVSETGTGGIFGKLLSRGRRAAPDRTVVENAVTNAAKEAQTGNIAPATRIVNATIDPVERQAAVDNLTKAYMSSMVEDRTAINNRLDDLAEQRTRFSDERITRETLISNLANEGYIPVPEGRRARFEDSLYDVQQRQSALMNDMEGVLQEVRDTISTKDFYDQVRSSLRNDPRIGTDINAALRRVDALENGARTTYGDTLRAVDVNRLKVEGNQKRADVGKNVDPVITDAWSNIARTGNEWLNSRINDDLFQRTNAEWSRLQTLQDTMRVLNNQQIDVGLLGRALGSYLAVVTGGSAGMAAGGAGALVVAGILSKMGADFVADMLRRKMFNPETTAIIRNVMRNDDQLREKLLREAKTMEARNTLEDFTRALPPGRTDVPQAQVFTPQEAPQAGVRSAGVPEERVASEAVTRNPQEQAVFNQQASRFNTPEAFIKAVNDNPRWRAKLQAAGVTPEQVAKVVFGGTAAYFLLAYTDENGLLPVGLVALSALPTNERNVVIKEAIDTAQKTGKTLKLSDEMADDVLKSLNMEEPLTKVMNVGGDIDADDVARLNALQTKSQKTALTDEELIEARAIMEKYGDVFPEGKAQSATTKTTDLLEEARKYDSAEEFVEAQPVLRGRQVADEMERIGTHNGGEEWKFVLKDVANEDYIKIEVPIETIRDQDVTLRGFLGRRLEETPTKKEMETIAEGLPVLDKDGYMVDGYNRTLRAIRDGKDTIEILTPLDSKFTRTQLEDIWKQANNAGTDLLEEARKYPDAESFVEAVSRSSLYKRDFSGARALKAVERNETYAKITGKSPDELVTVYRGMPRIDGGIDINDWVTLDKQTANIFAREKRVYGQTGSKIVSKKVKAGDLYLAHDSTPGDISEFIYTNKAAAKQTKEELEAIWEAANI